MTSVTTKPAGLQLETEAAAHLFDKVRSDRERLFAGEGAVFIAEMIRGELEVLARPRSGREAMAGRRGGDHGAASPAGGRQWTDGRVEKPRIVGYESRALAGDAVIASLLSATSRRKN
jgi:hypothetical protein